MTGAPVPARPAPADAPRAGAAPADPAALLAGLGLEVQRLDGGRLRCRAPGHREVPDRLLRLGVAVVPCGPAAPEHWEADVSSPDVADRLVAAAWALLAAF